MFYINDEEFKDFIVFYIRCFLNCFILTMRNLKTQMKYEMQCLSAFYINYEEFKVEMYDYYKTKSEKFYINYEEFKA